MATNVNALVTLAEVLSDIEGLPWDYALYIPASDPSWLPDMPVMVLCAEDIDDGVCEVDVNDFRFALAVSSVQDVVENACAQDAGADVLLLTKALKYYYDNDAFIVI